MIKIYRKQHCSSLNVSLKKVCKGMGKETECDSWPHSTFPSVLNSYNLVRKSKVCDAFLDLTARSARINTHISCHVSRGRVVL